MRTGFPHPCHSRGARHRLRGRRMTRALAGSAGTGESGWTVCRTTVLSRKTASRPQPESTVRGGSRPGLRLAPSRGRPILVDGAVSGVAGAALRSKAVASFRAMALPGAKACTFSKSSAGKCRHPWFGMFEEDFYRASEMLRGCCSVSFFLAQLTQQFQHGNGIGLNLEIFLNQRVG